MEYCAHQRQEPGNKGCLRAHTQGRKRCACACWPATNNTRPRHGRTHHHHHHQYHNSAMIQTIGCCSGATRGQWHKTASGPTNKQAVGRASPQYPPQACCCCLLQQCRCAWHVRDVTKVAAAQQPQQCFFSSSMLLRPAADKIAGGQPTAASMPTKLATHHTTYMPYARQDEGR